MKLYTMAAAALIAAACVVSSSAAIAVAAAVSPADDDGARTSLRRVEIEAQGAGGGESDEDRRLQDGSGEIDFYDPDRDVCKNSDTGTDADYGKCDESKFPQCQEGKELICYNRTNRRDKFYPDKHPYYYIDYKRVLCYPADWKGFGGCSSCTPGRWCKTEQRCILDELRYDCPNWR